MRAFVPSVLFFSVATLGLASELAAAEYSPATKEMARWDVDGYMSTSAGANDRVEFLGAGGEVIATVQVEPAGGGAFNLRVESPKTAGRQLFIMWDEARGMLSLRPPAWSRAVEASYDLQAASWMADPELELLTARYNRELALAALALDQTREKPARLLLDEIQGCAAPIGLSIPSLHSKSSWLTCNGIEYCRGWVGGSTASRCCEEAAQDANNCCTNSICWGCCRLGDCDTACVLGDYFCRCGVSGYTCRYPDY